MYDYDKFVKLVYDMRIAQKEYFTSKSYASLDKAKRLERQVDAEIQKIKNQNLFN